MVSIRFGPAGLGPVKDAVSNLEKYHELGLKACEVAFTYGPYIKKDDAIRIGKVAKKLGILLSIHAPYYINLNSKEIEKVEASKIRILKCVEIGHSLGAKRLVFHPGFYSGMAPEDTFEKIKGEVLELMAAIKKNGWKVELCAELMGKINVFGSIEEISKLTQETGCGVCLDFAHVLARYNDYKFDEIKKAFPQKKWHCHFSGIEYGEKGERNHKLTPVGEWKKILGFLKKLDKEVVIACESPDPVGDSILGLKILKELN
jgi:deoxyribonuclease IV